jgi:MYXO-CTERM domain-containing protein
MGMSIAAIGRGWDDTTIGDLRGLAEAHGWEVYPLLARALHGDDAGFCEHGEELNRLARAMLDELPVGAEPQNPRPGVAVHGWTTSSRFIRPREQHYVGAEDSEGFEFNGLDYLLLHNLYYLGTPGEWDGGPGEGVPECPPPGPDAGPAPDAGAPLDAGQRDASLADASTADATGGDVSPTTDDGCSCRVGGPSRTPWFWLSLMGVLLVRRRAPST